MAFAFIAILMFTLLLFCSVVYGVIVFIFGDFKVTNIILKELLLIRFNSKIQDDIVTEATKMLNRQSKDSLSAVIRKKNKKLIEESGGKLSSEDINGLKDSLSSLLKQDISFFDKETVKKLCKDSMLFSFMSNLSEVIRDFPLIEEMLPKKENEKAFSKLSSGIVRDLISVKIKPNISNDFDIITLFNSFSVA